MHNVRLVFVTAPDETVAVSLVRTMVEERLAACGNLVPGVRSIYRWEGEICDDAEWMILFKTVEESFAALRDRIVELHPYDCPEVVAVDVVDGAHDYLRWVQDQVGGGISS